MVESRVTATIATARRLLSIALLVSTASSAVHAQSRHGVIVDQTGLPLPGVTVEVMDGATVTTTIVSAPDGSFVLPDTVRGTHVVAHLEGFEPATVLRPDIERIVLLIARAATTTVVVGSALS